MSASNWKECPRCRKEDEDRIEELEEKVKEVTGDEFERLNDELQELEKKGYRDYNTLREDWEHTAMLTEEGEERLRVYYNASCRECGYGKRIRADTEKHEITVD